MGPSARGPGDLDHERRIADLEAIPGAEHDLRHGNAVHARSIGAAEIDVDEGTPPPRDPAVVPRDAAVAGDEVVVGGPPDREVAGLDDDPARLAVGIGDA